MIESSARRRPQVGDVIAYGFLWSHESDAGREDPAKERPCVVVMAVGERDHPTVLVVPVTTRKPERDGAIALTSGIFELNRPSWIIPWELNAFQWMGPDVARAASPSGAWWRMGRLSVDLRRQVIDRIREASARRAARFTRRSE